MTTPDTTPRLERLWEELPVGHAPLEDLVRGGRRVRRRRRALAALGTAAAVVAVVAGAAVGGTLLDGTGNSSREIVASEPVAPDGQRLVGLGNVAVAVPQDWTPGQGIDGCLAVDAPRAPNPGPAGPVADCPINGGDHPYVAAALLDSPASQFARRYATTSRTIGGVEVLVGQGECSDVAYCVSTRFPTFVVVPSQNVAFTVFGPERDQATLDAIVDSIQVLPEGFTTVPAVVGLPDVSRAAQVLRDAGFSVELTSSMCRTVVCTRPGPGMAQGTDPEAGSVVSKGSVIALFGG